MSREYPEQRSRVTVYKRETGEIEEYTVDAGPRISAYLCEQAGRTGFLTLMDRGKAVNIPVDVIDRWEMVQIEDTV
ncbi:hypothetical protein vB_RpoS-V16_22 [Ruegeria phage vB_RpoS-V16]|uniref:hypothetical protein n=1 Tax=Ruegeria phage vB_RpoS-V16 TaxID=2218618 RepID=UPI000DCAA7FC|nr:hypothetical protein JT311_gp22 [Ruegeria phage vB_RpoS-V16]AWY09458.1 hypothetical protein vB_RpoS-V16_22 [Ruegeria phage vB_RpoS-V16]